MSLFIKNLEEHKLLLAALDALDESILRAGQLAAKTLQSGGKILFCGNGGSAADSQHLAAELTGRFIKDRRPAIALSTDTSALTCIANDYSFEEIFSRQVSALGRPNDLIVGISTSGNSRNVIRAIEVANESGMFTLGLLGNDGGHLRALCQQSVVVPHTSTARVQECHILIGHTLCGLIEQDLGLA